MKVYLPAIEGHVPGEMVQTMRAFLEFCYIARHDIHDTNSLAALDDALQRFHRHREIFRTSGIRPDGFNLPRQHSLIHYAKLIRAFGAPNGLCSSITESKHIKAVKEPWRRSSRFNALNQMLLTNQRLDKLAAARIDFADREMLKDTCLPAVWENFLRTDEANSHPNLQCDPSDSGLNRNAVTNNNDSEDNGDRDNGDDEDEGSDAVDVPTVDAYVDLAKKKLLKFYPEEIAAEIELEFSHLIRKFLYDQQHPDNVSGHSISDLPMFYGKVTTYSSARATFHAPSDISGIDGMRREHIRAVKSWRKGPGRYDTIFVNTDSSSDGMRGLDVARVRLFFSISHDGVEYPCALFSQMTMKTLPPLSMLIALFVQHIFFRFLALDVFRRAFHSRTPLIHLQNSTLTNLQITMPSRPFINIMLVPCSLIMLPVIQDTIAKHPKSSPCHPFTVY